MGGGGSFLNVVKLDLLGGTRDIPLPPPSTRKFGTLLRPEKAISSITHAIFSMFIFLSSHDGIIFRKLVSTDCGIF